MRCKCTFVCYDIVACVRSSSIQVQPLTDETRLTRRHSIGGYKTWTETSMENHLLNINTRMFEHDIISLRQGKRVAMIAADSNRSSCSKIASKQASFAAGGWETEASSPISGHEHADSAYSQSSKGHGGHKDEPEFRWIIQEAEASHRPSCDATPAHIWAATACVTRNLGKKFERQSIGTQTAPSQCGYWLRRLRCCKYRCRPRDRDIDSSRLVTNGFPDSGFYPWADGAKQAKHITRIIFGCRDIPLFPQFPMDSCGGICLKCRRRAWECKWVRQDEIQNNVRSHDPLIDHAEPAGGTSIDMLRYIGPPIKF